MNGTPPDSSGQMNWGAHLRSGAFWMISLRWALRLTGLVSTVILARLLTPRDFGIVAMAMIVVGTLEMFNQTGQKLVLIRLEEPTDEHFNTAWTISFLLGLVIAVAILAVSPFTEFYFHEPRVVPVMQCLALRAILGGLENIGTVNFRRDLRFGRFFAYNVYPKVISFVITIVLAFVLRNYWALVAGMLSGQVTLIVLSYTMDSHRPRFTLSKVREIWSFSIWTFLRSIGAYLHGQIDQVVVGGFGGSSLMGRYSVASDIAASPSREINEPMVAVLYPVMSRLQQDGAALAQVFLRTLSWSAVICISASVGVALVADDMANLVLGPKWAGIGPLVAWLSIGAGIIGLSSGSYALFDAFGLPHVGARMIWLRTIILVAAVVPVAFLTHSVIDIAIVRALAAVLFLPGLYLVAGRLLGLSLADYVGCLWRPVVAALCMAAAVLIFNALIAVEGNVRLISDVVIGTVVFLASLLGAWVLAGRPPGPEMDFLANVRRYLPV
jgi:O-antigen/teichoic acid export membrane protein